MERKNKLDTEVVLTEGTESKQFTYDKLFWLFIAGSILGVIIEGVFCQISKGHWESHVVSVYGSFNILYGAAAVLFYVAADKLDCKPKFEKFLVFSVVATILELLCGLLLKDVLGMRAWSYDGSFMNYQGIICLGFSIMWGLAGTAFCKLCPKIDVLLERLKGKKWHIACVAMSVFMAVNFIMTAASIYRWSERHYGFEAKTKFEEYLDERAPDNWMQARFVEWEFLTDIDF